MTCLFFDTIMNIHDDVKSRVKTIMIIVSVNVMEVSEGQLRLISYNISKMNCNKVELS